MPHAIIWANVDPDICHRMASLDHNELVLLYITLIATLQYDSIINIVSFLENTLLYWYHGLFFISIFHYALQDAMLLSAWMKSHY